jgi:hypothetical protein
VLLPDALLNDSGLNVLVFDNTGNPPSSWWWGVREVSVESCFQLPSTAVYGKLQGGDQAHTDKVIYCFPGQSGNLNLTYEVYDIDNLNELDVILNGTKIHDETVTANNSWSGSRTLLLPDALVNDAGLNLLIFDNTMNPPNTWYWGVKNLNFAPTSTIAAAADSSQGFRAIEKAAMPARFHLAQNFPNPFNPTTSIRYELPITAEVRLRIYNLRGEVVRTLVEGEVSAGYHELTFDAAGLASEIYFYRLEMGALGITKKMVLAK